MSLQTTDPISESATSDASGPATLSLSHGDASGPATLSLSRGDASSLATLSQSHFGGGGRAAPPRPSLAGDPPDGGDRLRKGRGRPRRRPLKRASDALHKVIAGTLLIAAAIIMVDTVCAFVTHHPLSDGPLSSSAAMGLVSGVLLPVIILEIMTTVDTSGGNGLRVLRALMVIGIISSVRGILMITAGLSVDSRGKVADAHSAAMLRADTMVVLGLTVAFVLIRLFAGPRSRARA